MSLLQLGFSFLHLQHPIKMSLDILINAHRLFCMKVSPTVVIGTPSFQAHRKFVPVLACLYLPNRYMPLRAQGDLLKYQVPNFCITLAVAQRPVVMVGQQIEGAVDNNRAITINCYFPSHLQGSVKSKKLPVKA